MVQLEHSVKQIEGLRVVEFANFGPWNLVLLHFVWNETPVAILERNLFNLVRAENTSERDQI